MDFAKTISQFALNCGYDNCGIIAPEDLTDSIERLKERMEKVPESSGFYNGISANYSPVKERFPWAKSIIVLTFEHGKFRYPTEMRKRYAKAFFLSPEDNHTDGYDADLRAVTERRLTPPKSPHRSQFPSSDGRIPCSPPQSRCGSSRGHRGRHVLHASLRSSLSYFELLILYLVVCV